MPRQTTSLSAHGVDALDALALRREATQRGMSLSAHLRDILHAHLHPNDRDECSQVEHNRAALASLSSEPAPELVGYEAAADVRADRDTRS